MKKIELWKGDCLELMKSIPDNSIDMVLTDPPYGTTACKWDTVIDFELMWKELKRITKDNGAICLFGNEPFSSSLRMSNLKMYRYDWHWHKSRSGNFMNANRQPHKRIELISIFYKKLCSYYPIKILNPKRREKSSFSKSSLQPTFGVDGVGCTEKYTKASNSYEPDKLLPNSLIYFNNEFAKKGLHPTQKPVPILEYLIKTYTLENETVLDFTMGSGSAGVASKNLNRKFIGIEMDDEYFEIAKKRISET